MFCAVNRVLVERQARAGIRQPQRVDLRQRGSDRGRERCGIICRIRGTAVHPLVNAHGEGPFARARQFGQAAAAIAIVNVIVVVAFTLILRDNDLQALLQLIAASLASALGSAVAAAGTFAILGSLFGITTSYQLMELANPTHPLLRRLLIEAPGTYHHSLMVGNLAEQARNYPTFLEAIVHPKEAFKKPEALDRVRVLDCTTGMAIGHWASSMLAELGAEVIQVEPPGGDPLRQLTPFGRKEYMVKDKVRGEPVGLHFLHEMRNKYSVTLDVSKPGGREILKKLANHVDVVIEFPDEARAVRFERYLKSESGVAFAQRHLR